MRTIAIALLLAAACGAPAVDGGDDGGALPSGRVPDGGAAGETCCYYRSIKATESCRPGEHYGADFRDPEYAVCDCGTQADGSWWSDCLCVRDPAPLNLP